MFYGTTLLKELKKAGVDLVTGTPCSMLISLLEQAEKDNITYLATSNEGEAVALAAGAELGGRKPLVVFQNSGLGNAINPLTSLSIPFQIPSLLLITWRGEPDANDEPQHELMGTITPGFLDLMGIPWKALPEKSADLSTVLQSAFEHLQRHRTPYALLMKSSILRQSSESTVPELPKAIAIDQSLPHWQNQERWEQDDVLSVIQTNTGEDDIVLATTGYTGRALYALEDRPNQLYMVGSMGCVATLGLGLALACPDKRVVTIDGDGALLMHLGSLATLGAAQPKNLIHVLLDNGVHDSTGSQATASANVDFATVAKACGYAKVVRAYDLEELEIQLQETWEELTFLHVRTLPRSNRNLPRPELSPAETAQRLRSWLR